jgi:hypothetical protein
MWTIRKAVPPGRFRTVLRAFASVVALVLLLAHRRAPRDALTATTTGRSSPTSGRSMSRPS